MVTETIEKFEPPSILNFDAKLCNNWKLFRQEQEIFITAAEAYQKSDKLQISILLHTNGKRGCEVYNTFTWNAAGDEKKFKVVLDKLEAYCAPKQNITLCRYRFFICRQAESETIDSFQTKLKKLANGCAFADLKQSPVRDRLVIGVNDPSLREKYLRTETLDPDKALTMGHAAEAATRWNLCELKGKPKEATTLDADLKTHQNFQQDKLINHMAIPVSTSATSTR